MYIYIIIKQYYGIHLLIVYINSVCICMAVLFTFFSLTCPWAVSRKTKGLSYVPCVTSSTHPWVGHQHIHVRLDNIWKHICNVSWSWAEKQVWNQPRAEMSWAGHQQAADKSSVFWLAYLVMMVSTLDGWEVISWVLKNLWEKADCEVSGLQNWRAWRMWPVDGALSGQSGCPFRQTERQGRH